jgi:acyl-CoA synthetase (AMP-forming)/AMP-acid ligase II
MDAVAAGLRARGLAPGQRVVTAMEPSLPHVVTILGAMAAGLVPAPLNIRLTGPEAREYLESLDPSLVVADPAHGELATATGRPVLVLPKVLADGDWSTRLAPLSDAVATDPAAPLELDETTPAIVFGTGGTTGSPKGAYHSHRSLWLWLNTCALGNPRTPADVELCFSPFFHITLGTNVLAPLIAGGEVWIQRRFDAGQALAAIDEGATRLMGAPTMFAKMRAEPRFEQTARDNVTAIRFGSAPSAEQFVRELMEDYPNAKIRAGFGATEFGSVMGFDHTDLLAGRYRGVGRPLPGVTVRILGADGREAASGTPGELVVSCPWQTGGYYGRPDDTAQTYQPDGVHIGDLASRAEDGWVTVVGRVKDMLITGGENVFPREVEEAVLRHPAVADAIVYGVPDPEWGERVEVAIVPLTDPPPALDDIREFGRAELAGYKLPKTMRVVDAVPLTANNKPDRRRAVADSVAAAVATA